MMSDEEDRLLLEKKHQRGLQSMLQVCRWRALPDE